MDLQAFWWYRERTWNFGGGDSRRIQNPVQRCSFFAKTVNAFKNAASQMFDWVLNTPLRVVENIFSKSMNSLEYLRFTYFQSNALRNLAPFVQFKKREKHRKACNFIKSYILHGCFSRFLNCTNGTKSRNASQFLCQN